MDTGETSPPTVNAEDIACDRSFAIPDFAALESNPKMPDPFTFLDGTKVASKADWVCRQKEISQLAQAFIYGRKPPPPEKLEASYVNGKLTLDMEDRGHQWTLSVDITAPATAGSPGMFSVDENPPSGVGSIKVGLSWLTGQIAAADMYARTKVANAETGTQVPKGRFYEFWPDYPDTGSLMAWAWTASRIVDGLEQTEGHNIDPTKLYGLGCSRNGKTAATMALFDRRIAMVGMLSPGSGSTSGWRVADSQTADVQTADQIWGETSWMGEPFGQFANKTDLLPVDQHEVLALAWPRPLIIREGTNDSWNCPVCVYTTVKYTQMIYEALGNKDDVGFVHYNGGHCESGGQAWSSLHTAFVNKFLKGDTTVSTAGMFTESFDFDATRWQDGELTPLP